MTDSDRSGPPSKEDFDGLPPTAIVAFAVRCARRVQVLVTHFRPDAEEGHREAIDKAISLAEEFATRLRGGPPGAYSAVADRAAAMVITFADAAAHVGGRYVAGGYASVGYAAAASAHTADGVSNGHYGDGVGDGGYPAEVAAADAARSAIHAAGEFGVDAAGMVRVAEWRDLALLRAAAASEDWRRGKWAHRLGPSVPPEFFGALWPDGEPEGWPSTDYEANNEDTERPRQGLKLRVEIAEWAPAGEVVEELINLYKALDQAHKALGGQGLSIEDWDMFCRADVPAEVLS